MTNQIASKAGVYFEGFHRLKEQRQSNVGGNFRRTKWNGRTTVLVGKHVQDFLFSECKNNTKQGYKLRDLKWLRMTYNDSKR